ncbi:MAG: flagellar hook-basal body complex protein, partial [Calditrichaeota bacterium]
MMRSLFSGVSGLRNHQLYLDVIGNNIANVNTVGFKTGRMTFSEIFAQTIRGATRPQGNIGGTNPIQVGLGMSVATIDTLHKQGSIESTGQITDLALQGNGFFIVSDGEKRFFTRAGAFQFDASGSLTMSGTGMRVQGFLANKDGVIEAGTKITDLTFPLNQKIAARATTKVDLGGNLDAASTPLGTILSTERLYAIEEAGDDSAVEGLYARGTANNVISGMVPNSTQVTITITDPTTGNTVVERSYTYVDDDTSSNNGAFHSFDDLVAE